MTPTNWVMSAQPPSRVTRKPPSRREADHALLEQPAAVFRPDRQANARRVALLGGRPNSLVDDVSGWVGQVQILLRGANREPACGPRAAGRLDRHAVAFGGSEE